jgi:hypothetical protein
MNAVDAARTALYEVLQRAFTPTPWRVHRISPPQMAAPCVFIDTVRLRRDESLTIAQFAIVAVCDGLDRKQTEALDTMLALAWDAGQEVGASTESSPGALDVGGPSLRAHVVSVDIPLLAITLCSPTLVTTASSGVSP